MSLITILPARTRRNARAARDGSLINPPRAIGDLAIETFARHAAAKESVRQAARAIALRSGRLAGLFGAFCGRDLASFFHRVRLLDNPPAVEGPLVLFSNHPSWWDVELFAWLAATMFAGRRGFAPMDAVNFERYRMLELFGVFPVMPGSFAGASAFLALAEQILQEPDGLLLVTLEGRFRDVRVRPIIPMPGLAHLARRMPTATFVPLAVDYVFWSERRPNLLVKFGEPIHASEFATSTTDATTARLGAMLEACMSALAEAGQSRDPARFRTLLKGRDGMSFLFDTWRRVEALCRRRSFVAAHRNET